IPKDLPDIDDNRDSKNNYPTNQSIIFLEKNSAKDLVKILLKINCLLKE
ncbi:23314_t:CDS:2, partial [Gigaspora margarita]